MVQTIFSNSKHGFKEGAKILTDKGYIPIQDLKKETIAKRNPPQNQEAAQALNLEVMKFPQKETFL